jgi:myo-inositol-1(or 4)-monophosphatase
MVEWLRVFQRTSKEVYRQANPILGSERAGEIMGRGAGGDMTRQIDVLAEEIVIKSLEKEGVPCILVSEECGTKVIGKNPRDYVVLDGIDGTTNAVRGISFVSTSMAHASGPRLRDVDVGLVTDLSRGTTFSAEKEKGAYEGSSPLRPSSVTNLAEGLIGVELPVKLKRRDIQPCITRLIPLIANIRKFRHLGSIALELCYVASGRLDAYVDIREIIRATDFAAAYLIVREAGAFMATPDGGEVDMELKATARTSFLAAANQTIFSEILRLLQTGREG